MNTQIARNIMNEAARLLELASTFQARYGNHYKMGAHSPADTWKLYNDMLDSQHIIAHLLSPDAVATRHQRYGAWWEHEDVMRVAMAQALINEVGHLLACCKQLEDGVVDHPSSYAITSAQQSIAGLLHPDSFRQAEAPPANRLVG